MKNKELLNSCYKYLNRFINANDLIERLENIDKKDLSKKEKKEINNLIKQIEKLIKDTTNEEDEVIIKEKEKTNNLIKKIDKLPLDTECEEFLNKQLTNLKKDYERERDSQERWLAIVKYITNNKYFNTCFENLSDYELLEFIAQYICAPFPPKLSQEEFNNIAKAGIEHDEREWLWRLAFNYGEKDMNFDLISDYFIEKKDGYYLAELISAIGQNLNIDSIIDKITDTSLIKELNTRKSIINSYVTEEQFKRLLSKIKES